MKKTKNILSVILIILCAVFCFFRADIIKPAVYDAIIRCLTVIIPSLYAMMIISVLLVKTNITSFGYIPCCIFSMVAGYPTGAKILFSEYDSGNISRKNAEILSGVFFGAGGAFIFGCTSHGGAAILVSNLLANCIISVFIFVYYAKNNKKRKSSKKISFSPDMLTQSINSAGYSMLEICFAVVFFSVITAILRHFNVISALADFLSTLFALPEETAENILCAVLDVTAVSNINDKNFNIIPLVSGLVSFGGLCVFMQIMAIFRGKLSVAPLFFCRIVSAFLSGIICKLILPFFIKNKTIAVAMVDSKLYKASSPIPSVLLILMTAMLFYTYEKEEKKF